MDRGLVETLLTDLDIYQYLYPTNYADEKQRFLEQDTGNPVYDYPAFTEQETVADGLAELQAQAETGLDTSLVNMLHHRHSVITAIATDQITDQCRAYYGTPSTELVNAARNRFVQPTDEDRTVPAATLQTMYAAVFDRLGMEYSCRLVKDKTIRNQPLQRTLLLPQEKQFGRRQAERLLVHETTHAVRTVNGMQQEHPAYVYGTAGYELAEEGLATFNEAAVGVLADTLPRITARVLAVAAADQSFRNLFQEMLELGLDQETAFIRTYRVKRGLADTGASGGFLKDHIYFAGLTRLEEQEKLADKLYAGKIGFDDLGRDIAPPRITRETHLDAVQAVAAEYR